MSNFLFILTLLIIPIFILLFVRRIKRKKIYYSFTFLQRFKSQSFKQILLKLFQLFYDVFFDFIIAIVIALILSNIIIDLSLKNKTAFIIDTSYSMMNTDINGITPFEKAVIYYYNHKNDYTSHDLYLGGYDLLKGKSKIIKVSKMKNILNPKTFVSEFFKNYQIFEFDANEIFSKKLMKYKKTIFITDIFPFDLSKNLYINYEIIELGSMDKDFFYPISLICDPASDLIYCYFIKSPGNYTPKIELYDANKLFINAQDKVKMEFSNENTLVLETQERTLMKVTLYNQSYYINLAQIPVSLKSSGEYSDMVKNILSSHFNYENEIAKFKEKGFLIDKFKIPSIVFYQKSDFNKIDKNLEKELKTKIKTEKTIITIQFNQNDYDTIIDPKFTAGFLLATNKNTIFNNLIDIKKNYKINLKNLNSFYPVFLSIDFIYKPQTIIYFLLLSDFLKDKFINKQLTYISELQQPLKGKSEMLEINRTSILYKINNKLLYKNIDINEVFPYKNQIEIDNIKISENNLLYIIILIILYSSKIIFFMMLKNK